jgi:hypothetical protein
MCRLDSRLSTSTEYLAQPLLQGPLDRELRCRGQFRAIGCEDQLHDTRAKIRAVDPLARGSEKQLLNHLLYVFFVSDVGSATPAVDAKWEGDVHVRFLSPALGWQL